MIGIILIIVFAVLKDQTIQNIKDDFKDTKDAIIKAGDISYEMQKNGTDVGFSGKAFIVMGAALK